MYEAVPGRAKLSVRRPQDIASLLAILVFRIMIFYDVFRSTRITLSPRRNILLIYRSLFTGFPFFPSLERGVSVHISLTCSRTIFECLSNALTRASNFLLLRQLMRTWLRFFTAFNRTLIGPVSNSNSSSFARSASERSARFRATRSLPSQQWRVAFRDITYAMMGALCQYRYENRQKIQRGFADEHDRLLV